MLRVSQSVYTSICLYGTANVTCFNQLRTFSYVRPQFNLRENYDQNKSSKVWRRHQTHLDAKIILLTWFKTNWFTSSSCLTPDESWQCWWWRWRIYFCISIQNTAKSLLVWAKNFNRKCYNNVCVSNRLLIRSQRERKKIQWLHLCPWVWIICDFWR